MTQRDDLYDGPDRERFFDTERAPDLEPSVGEQCAACAANAAHAYSDATTAGFFFTECDKHRKKDAPVLAVISRRKSCGKLYSTSLM
jgi:hypothetical protein